MGREFRKRIGSLIKLNKIVYLISPKEINKSFYSDLEKVLSYGNVKFFQLRIKDKKKNNIIKIAKKIKAITNKYKIKFIINDNYKLVSKINADGCHMGQFDGSIKIARKKLKKKILGVTCHNSLSLAKKAVEYKADYLAFGSFYKSKLKPNASRANFKVLKQVKKKINKPVVVIGGINNLNYKKLMKLGAKYIAISSFIWDNPKLKPEFAIKKFK